jgi:hypothetical protein
MMMETDLKFDALMARLLDVANNYLTIPLNDRASQVRDICNGLVELGGMEAVSAASFMLDASTRGFNSEGCIAVWESIDDWYGSLH